MSIADESRVLRLCKGNWVLKDADGNPTGDVVAEAFKPHANGLSVNNLDHYSGTDPEKLAASRAAISLVFQNLRKAHKLAVLKVADIKEVGRQSGNVLDVVADPILNNPAHALVTGIGMEDFELHAALSTAVLSLEAVVL